jgi:hypothetical protein
MTETPTHATDAQKACPHEQFGAQVGVHHMEDSGAFIAEVTIGCAQCGLPFRFKGVAAGVSWERPTCSIEGLTLNAPIEPELVRVLQAGARFEMPKVDRVQH